MLGAESSAYERGKALRRVQFKTRPKNKNRRKKGSQKETGTAEPEPDE